MRRLIFGCGYLGQRVASRWLAQGDEVWAVTRSSERAANLERQGLRTVVADVTEPGTLRDLPTVDCVLHSVAFDRSSGTDRRAVTVNGLANVLRAVQEKCQVFLHVSSTSVYGQQAGEIVTEESPCEPTEESGCLCREAELLVLAEPVLLPDVRRHVLRLSGIYGPDRLLSRAEAIRSGAALPGPADAWLNLIHVDDAAKAVIAVAERGQRDVYLVSDDRPVRRQEYYMSLARLLQAPDPTFDPQAVARHMRGINKRCDNRRLRGELKVELAFPTIEQGLPTACGCQSVRAT